MAAASAEGMASLSDQDAKSITVVLGQSFEICLWEDRTRGEQWVPAYDSAALALTGDDYSRTASGNAVDAGRRTFAWQALSAGQHRMVFEKRMGWKFTAEDRRVFLIHVADGAGPSRVQG